MESTYRQQKEDVLRNYDSFVQMIDELRQGKAETPYDPSMDALKVQAENIRKNRFVLMVVGEAKSGKSTFINAYLKKDILPMDVKQCTNAIVEIKDGETYRLTATYADNRTEVIENEDAIKGFMAKNAAMDDDYRDIPVALINSELLMKWKDKPESENDINDLLKNVAEDNIHRLPPDEYERKIRDYIRERKNSWRDLVKTIVIEYPFEDQELKGIEILDTPGVNAEGKVGDITNEFVEKANAVMFLKPITGSALESSSFKKFLDSKSADRNRNAMFLVLTRAANETGKNRDSIMQEAHKQYSNIDEHQIIAVDSKAEMFANSISGKSFGEMRQLIRKLRENEELDSFLLDPWFDAEGDGDKFVDGVRKLSNFQAMRDRLNLFAHKAEYLALSDFLGRMLTVSGMARAKISESVGNMEQKAEDPALLNTKLLNKKRELDSITLKINRTVDEIADRYVLPTGEIAKKADAVMSDYRKEIDAIDAGRGDSLDELEKITFRKVDIFKDVESNLQKDFVAACDEQLAKYSQDLSIDYKILKPDLTKEEIESIKTESRKDAYKTEYYTEGTCFKETKFRSVFSQRKYFETVRKDIESRIEKIKNDAITDVFDFVTKISGAYRISLARNAELQKQEYDEILQAKRTAEELQELIRIGKERLGKFTGFAWEMDRVKRGIDKNLK